MLVTSDKDKRLNSLYIWNGCLFTSELCQNNVNQIVVLDLSLKISSSCKGASNSLLSFVGSALYITSCCLITLFVHIFSSAGFTFLSVNAPSILQGLLLYLVAMRSPFKGIYGSSFWFDTEYKIFFAISQDMPTTYWDQHRSTLLRTKFLYWR